MELQSRIEGFRERGASLVAISVDEPEDSIPWVQEKGFTFEVVSDPNQAVIEDLYHLRNPSSEELSLHAVYIIDSEGRVFYRKVALRRPVAQELFDALDHHARMAE